MAEGRTIKLRQDQTWMAFQMSHKGSFFFYSTQHRLTSFHTNSCVHLLTFP